MQPIISFVKERWICVLYRFDIVSLSMVFSCVSETSNLFPPAGLHTRNCACPHCTSTSPSGFMCRTPLPRKDHLLQSWCPYNPLPPDAALVGPNLCSNPSRATRWFSESSKKKLRFFKNNLRDTLQDYHGTKWVPATLPYGKAEIYRNVCLSYSICKTIV